MRFPAPQQNIDVVGRVVATIEPTILDYPPAGSSSNVRQLLSDERKETAVGLAVLENPRINVPPPLGHYKHDFR